MIGDQIRLIDLLPRLNGTQNSLVRCNSRVVSLSEKPQYEALSYTWGDPSHPKIPIEVAGEMLGVSKNLHDALCRLRLPAATRTLWVDQVCIYQWDLVEKASQVQLMRQIYSGCSCCIAWLGEISQDIPPSDAGAVVEFLEYLSSVAQSEDSDQIPVPLFMANFEAFEGPIRALQRMSQAGNPWWWRMWTVQEAVLPQTICLVWGKLSIPWEILHRAVRLLTIRLPNSLARLYTEQVCRTLNTLVTPVVWLEIDRIGPGDPLDLSIKWRLRKASDPRDKLYALLGLPSKAEMPTMKKCDYTGMYRTLDIKHRC
jgi:hypothetical protein